MASARKTYQPLTTDCYKLNDWRTGFISVKVRITVYTQSIRITLNHIQGVFIWRFCFCHKANVSIKLIFITFHTHKPEYMPLDLIHRSSYFSGRTKVWLGVASWRLNFQKWVQKWQMNYPPIDIKNFLRLQYNFCLDRAFKGTVQAKIESG